MTGLSGLLLTSTIGLNIQLIPIANASCAVTFPI